MARPLEAPGPRRSKRPLEAAPLTAAGFATLAACTLALACGSAGPARSSAAGPGSASDDDGYLDSSADERVEQGLAGRCADGSCFPCGEGLCPRGFYCDQDASGGPACSWLPACPAEPNCGCLTRALGADCRCDEHDGGAYLSCQ